ncbi:MAG: acyl-CoA dehydrogenase family protein [Acetobacterales bacterium]
MNFEPTDEQREMVEQVRRFRHKVIEPNGMKWLDGTFPWENMKGLGELGVLGMAVPEEYGGMSASILDTVLVLEEIAKGCYVTAMAVMAEVGTQTRIIATFAPEAVKREILPKIASGDAILAICMTEPDTGTDIPAIRTNTTVEGNRVVVNGAKTLCSRAEVAEMFVVFTRVDGIPGREGIGCVLVPKDARGLSISTTYHTMGGEYLSDVRFDDVELPPDNLVVKRDGLKKLMNAFNTQRVLNPCICLGLAEGALEHSIRYLRERKAFGQRIGDYQGLRWKAADMAIQIEAGRSLLYRAAASGDPFPDPTLAAMAKVYNNEMGIRVCSDAIQIHGGYGFTDEFAVSRFYRGVRYGSLGGGTTETLRNWIGRYLVEKVDLETGILAPDLF